MYTPNRLVYTLKPFKRSASTHMKVTEHVKKKSEKTFEVCESENSSTCTKYIVTSVHVWKTTKKKDNQNHVCILLHREALSVIRCVLLQAYSY